MSPPIERFYRRAARVPDAIAVAGTAGGAVTYSALARDIAAVAAGFQERDPAPGSRVGICLGNSYDHLVALLAAYAAGKVWVPLSPRNARSELDAMIAATRPSIVIDDAAQVRELIAAWDGRSPSPVERGAEDAQIIKFSGGSTGRPKPVVQSQRCVNAQADGLRDFFEFQSDDVNLIAAPLTHGASCFVLPILEVGGRHVLVDQAKPDAIFDAIESYGVTTIYAPPTLLYSLIEHPRAPASARGRSKTLRHVIYSAAPMPPQRIRDCQRLLGPVIETAYGQVEAPQIISAMRADELLMEENLLSVGRPSAVATVGIVNDTGELLPSGEIGEIVVSGPLVMTGYLDREEDTARTIVDGWLHTGDLFIRGRLREVINTGGFKVYPADVEASLARHRAVDECAVFGMPDAKWGEAVNAAVIVRKGAIVSAEQLIAWVKAELGSVKAPKRVWFVEQLERNAAGKVSRSGVRARLTAG
jgi:acyl-CoA synthetase (AMP-forming)/AMP-acid ligase II